MSQEYGSVYAQKIQSYIILFDVRTTKSANTQLTPSSFNTQFHVRNFKRNTNSLIPFSHSRAKLLTWPYSKIKDKAHKCTDQMYSCRLLASLRNSSLQIEREARIIKIFMNFK